MSRIIFDPVTPDPKDLEPFSEPFGRIEGTGIHTFESAMPANADLKTLGHHLQQIDWGMVELGAAGSHLQPLMIRLDTGAADTAGDIVRLLRLSNFESQFVPDLNKSHLRYAGYRPGTQSDEIHNEFEHQYMFLCEKFDEDGEETGECALPSEGAHGELLEMSADKKIWYVLKHMKKVIYQGYENMGEVANLVLLFAVTISPCHDYLIGVFGHQVCHNLCD